MWRHNYVIDRNEYLIFTLSVSINPWVYSLQFLFKSTNNSLRYERKCEWVFFFWTQCMSCLLQGHNQPCPQTYMSTTDNSILWWHLFSVLYTHSGQIFLVRFFCCRCCQVLYGELLRQHASHRCRGEERHFSGLWSEAEQMPGTLHRCDAASHAVQFSRALHGLQKNLVSVSLAESVWEIDLTACHCYDTVEESGLKS